MDSANVGDDLLGELDALAEVCDPGTNVVLIGTSNDIELYRELMRRGVSEYIVKPIAPRRIYEAVAGIVMDPDAPPMGRLLTFISSRGGAGSSSLAHNIGGSKESDLGFRIVPWHASLAHAPRNLLHCIGR